MKLSTRIAFAAFVVLPVWNSPQLLAAPSNAGSMPRVVTAPKVPRITRDNFVSLSWSLSESVFADTGSTTTVLAVKGNILSYQSSTHTFGGSGGGGVPLGASRSNRDIETVGLSNNQLLDLIKQLNDSPLVTAPKNSRNSSDAFATLIFSDENNKDQAIQIICSGDAVSASNAKIAALFLAMVRQKFPNIVIAAPTTSTSPKANATSH